MANTGVDRSGDAFERGRSVWSSVAVDRAVFEAHVAALPAAEWHADLYLACACSHGDPEGLAAFDRQILSEVGLYIRRIDASSDLADEVRQTLRERLLVKRNDQPPRIAEYSGRGALGAWVRVSAVRVAIDLLRKRDGVGWPTASVQPEAADLDPVSALLRTRYQSEYQLALREALGELTAKERNLVRMHFVDGLSIDRIGTAYRVHRATAARWIQSLRDRLLDETYRRLGTRLQLSPAEFASLTAVVRSQLHLSLSGILRPSAD